MGVWITLRSMGFPEHLIILMRNLYRNQKATVRTEDGETESFGIGKGVRQGCILSPILFNLYAERVMREAGLEDSPHGIRIGGRSVNNLRFADDTTLAANSKKGLTELLQCVKVASEKAGLFLNVKKTKVLTTSDEATFKLNDVEIEVVKGFAFLGSLLDHEGSCKAEILRRIAMGRTAMMGLQKIWKDKNILKTTKVKLVQALVFPVVTYGSETWTTLKSEDRKIAAFEQWCWRRMLRISWKEKRTNVSVANEVATTTSLLSAIIKQRLQYFGHVTRREGLEASIMLGMGEGKRRRGKPRTRWIDTIINITGLNLQQLVSAARNRLHWRRVIVDVTRDRLRSDGTR